jgi:heme A synthase
MAMAVVACLALLIVSAWQPHAARADRPRRDLGLARSSLLVAGLCYVQLLVGAHVTGIGAGLAFRDFPLMGGAVFPVIASEREAFHATHRLLALALALAVVLLVVHARRARASRVADASTPAARWLVRLPWLCLGLVAVQVVLGAANLWTGTSWTTVVPHLAVASWIWTALVFQTLLAYRHAPRVPAGPATSDARQEVPA